MFKASGDQDSGNICFGVESSDNRKFIKFAGAKTVRYNGEPENAVLRLEATLLVYRSIHHEALIEFRGAEEIGGGFAMVFSRGQMVSAWEECMSSPTGR